MAYQSPAEGFRGEVTAAAVRVLEQYNKGKAPDGWHCPGCGDQIHRNDKGQHAAGCVLLRSDVADEL